MKTMPLPLKTRKEKNKQRLIPQQKPVNLRMTIASTQKAGIKPIFTFIDLFAGIGGFRIALEQHGGECIGFSEIDKESISVYKNNFTSASDAGHDLGDITQITSVPEVDVLVGGVPCQSWSVAGKMRGFEDPRGKLWLDTIRLVRESQPKVFIFENVKGLIDPRNKANLDLIVTSFKELGYTVYYRLLNSFDFGLPQNRDRIYIVGFREGLVFKTPFTYPEPLTRPVARLYQLFDSLKHFEAVKQRFDPFTIFGSKIPMGRGRFKKVDQFNDFFVFCDTRNGHTTIHSWDLIKTSRREKQICEVIMRNRRKKIYGSRDGNPLPFSVLKNLLPGLIEKELDGLIQKKIIKYVPDDGYEFVHSKNSSGINGVYRVYLPESEVYSTLTATGTKDMVATESITGDSPQELKANFINKIYKPKKFRPITSHESASLQGFPADFRLHTKDALAKKQFGNAVSVPVVYNVMASVLKTGILSQKSSWKMQKKMQLSQKQKSGCEPISLQATEQTQKSWQTSLNLT